MEKATSTGGIVLVLQDSPSFYDASVNLPPPPQVLEERAGGWSVMSCPPTFTVHLDVMDRSMLHDYRLETHCVTERAMQELYPGWKHGCRKKYSGIDGLLKVRAIEDLSIGDCVRIFYGYDQLIGPLWQHVKAHATKVQLEMRDMIGFIMVVSHLGFYGISAKAYYDNVRDMYKRLGHFMR